MDVILANPENVVFPGSVLRAMLDRLAAVAPGTSDAGKLNGAKVHAYANDLTPTKDNVLADFTAPTFTGYAPSAAIAWGTAFEAESGQALLVGGTAQFACTADPATPESIYGVYVTDGAGTGLIYSERFANPVVIDKSGDGFAYIPEVAAPKF